MRMLEEVRHELASQVQRERQVVADEVRTIAQEMANKILGRNVA